MAARSAQSVAKSSANAKEPDASRTNAAGQHASQNPEIRMPLLMAAGGDTQCFMPENTFAPGLSVMVNRLLVTGQGKRARLREATRNSRGTGDQRGGVAHPSITAREVGYRVL